VFTETYFLVTTIAHAQSFRVYTGLHVNDNINVANWPAYSIWHQL